MKLDRALNLVLTLDRESGASIQIHSTPISRGVFEANYKLIARAHAELFGRGTAYAIGSGPRIAALTLRDVSRQEATEHGIEGEGDAPALLAEIRRLTHVIAPGDNGWSALPVDVALNRGGLDADEWAEVESQLVFGCVISAMTARAKLQKVLGAMASVMGVQLVSQNATEFAASLQTSKPAAPIQTPTSPVPR